MPGRFETRLREGRPIVFYVHPREVDPHLYRERNLCERFWSKVKQYRRVATRYEKKAANFLAFVKVAAVMVMLK